MAKKCNGSLKILRSAKSGYEQLVTTIETLSSSGASFDLEFDQL
jgi:hypothetical protein